jgi:hypothetical protein
MVSAALFIGTFIAGIICGGWWMLSYINGTEEDA